MLTAKQQEYLKNCNHRWNVKYGATGSGKSFLDYAVVIPKRIMSTRGEGLIVLLGNTRDTLDRNILQPMRDIWGTALVPELKAGNTIQLFGKKCYVLGADKITSVKKIQGQTVEYAYGDEVATWSEPLFQMLKSRLRCKHSVFDGTCNPDSPVHWFKAFLDSDADIYQQKYIIDDNPTLPPEFVEELKKEYEGTVYYRRYILGEWSKAEGLVFPNYEKAIEAVEGVGSGITVSIDYGTLNAFAALCWCKIGDVYYAYKGYYYSGRQTGIQKTDEEYSKDLEKWLAPEIDNALNGKKIDVIIDPSAASFITLLRRKHWCKVHPADNNVLDGIRDTNTAIYRGLIKISPEIKEWRTEAAGYVWDEDSGEERPIKVDDHMQDATRYFVRTKKLVRPHSEYRGEFL